MSREMDAKVAETVMGLHVVGWATCVNTDGAPSVMLNTDVESWMCEAWHGPVFTRVDPLAAPEPDDLTLNGVPDWALEPVPAYTADVAADHHVLVHVRDKWDDAAQVRFGEACEAVWRTRGIGSLWDWWQNYQPGDYASAALAAALSALSPTPTAGEGD